MKLLINSKVYVLIVSVLFIINSCTEIYNPEIEVSNKIIYVEGTITDTYGPHQIWLRYTSTYTDKATFPPVIGASVLILEDNTREYVCAEFSEGLYKTENTFIAKKGHSYTLKITLPDSTIFESNPQILPTENIPIDSVYGLKESRAEKYYNYSGEFMVVYEDVNQIYADIPSASKNTFYRFRCRNILEILSAIAVIIPPYPGPFYVNLYIWESLISEDLAIIEVNSQLRQVAKFPITHLRDKKILYDEFKHRYNDEVEACYDTCRNAVVKVPVKTDTGLVFIDSLIVAGYSAGILDVNVYHGWILEIDQYSISRDAYNFWSDIKKLEEAEGEIFDPIATQIRGNMFCTTDNSRIILGLFEVASKSTTRAFVNYKSTGDQFLGKMLDNNIKIPYRGWTDTIPPDFWVDKIHETY